MLISLLAGAAAVAAPLSSLPPLPPCGRAYSGRLVSTDAADADMMAKPLVMHVRVCDAAETQIPFHVGNDRSRTWFLTRTAEGVRLKHRHRHADGSLDSRTFYGGDSRGPVQALPGGGWRLSFPADAESKALFVAQGIPQSAGNFWSVEHVPGRLFAYELKRPGRFFRVEFDLATPIAVPPPPWGDEAQANH